MPTIREFMTREPVTIEAGKPIEEAARLMREHDIGLLPVMEGGQFKGVVTDRDIVIRAVADGKFQERIGSIVSTRVQALSPDDDVRRAAEMMSQSDVRRLPVCEGDRLVGIVSVGDLATRANSNLAGAVMERTGPETSGTPR